MALVTTKGIYALSAMKFLMGNESDKPVKIRHIAAEAHIPQNFLELILLDLKKAGFLKSIKGAHGGYLLNMNVHEIMINELLEAVEDNPFELISKTQSKALEMFWYDMGDEIEALFKKPLTTLKSYDEKVAAESMYYI